MVNTRKTALLGACGRPKARPEASGPSKIYTSGDLAEPGIIPKRPDVGLHLVDAGRLELPSNEGEYDEVSEIDDSG